MLENRVLEVVPQLVVRIEEMLNKKYPFEHALRLVIASDTVTELKLVHGDKEKLELAVREKCQGQSLERARLSASSGQATKIAGGRFISTRRSGKDEAAGARKDRLEDEMTDYTIADNNTRVAS
jgi:hypothetical protein